MCDVFKVLTVEFDETEAEKCWDVKADLLLLLVVFEDYFVQGFLVYTV